MSIVVTTASQTTALDIFKRSLRLLGVYASGEDPSAEEAQDGLASLNDLLDELSLGAMVYAKTLDQIPLTSNQQSVTVGPSGSFVTARPVQVLDESYILVGSVSYPLATLTLQAFNDIYVKTLTGIPRGIWAQMDMPDMTVTMYPVPSQTMTLMLWSQKVLASFPTLTTTVSLPPGYKKMLAFLLAIDLAPEYEVNPPAAVVQGAASARRKIARINLQVPSLSMPTALQKGRFNILTGTNV